MVSGLFLKLAQLVLNKGQATLPRSDAATEEVTNEKN
jgi:hypothetical protein